MRSSSTATARNVVIRPPSDTAQWTPTRMAETLSQIIRVKDYKLRKVASGFDECFLAIVTDEPGIDEWLSRDAVSRCWSTVQHIHRAFLVMSYHPATNADLSCICRRTTRI